MKRVSYINVRDCGAGLGWYKYLTENKKVKIGGKKKRRKKASKVKIIKEKDGRYTNQGWKRRVKKDFWRYMVEESLERGL